MKKSKISRGTDIYDEKAGIINREIEYSLIKKNNDPVGGKLVFFHVIGLKKEYSFIHLDVIQL